MAMLRPLGGICLKSLMYLESVHARTEETAQELSVVQKTTVLEFNDKSFRYSGVDGRQLISRLFFVDFRSAPQGALCERKLVKLRRPELQKSFKVRYRWMGQREERCLPCSRCHHLADVDTVRPTFLPKSFVELFAPEKLISSEEIQLHIHRVDTPSVDRHSASL